MNRNVVIGGVVVVAILLAVAAYFLISGRTTSTTGGLMTGEPAGPIALNNVTVVTDHSTSQSEDGRTLNVTFPKFELAAKGGETTSAVFSTTWRLKLAPEERAVVAAVSIDGYMKSAGVPVPSPVPAATPEPAVAAAPAPEGTPAAEAPPAEGTTPPAEQPAATPAPAAPAKPVAGDGVARVIVSIGGDISITEWRDWTGDGAQHKVSKAVSFASAGADLRDGATVPVTVTVEVFGATATETIARLNAIDLRVFPEDAPLPSAAPVEAVTEAPAEVTPPVEDATPAEGATPPAEGTTPPAEGETTPAEVAPPQ